MEEGSFDAALMVSNAIEHTRGRENRVRTLAEIRRTLKPNGLLILSTHTRASRLRYRLYWTVINGLRAAKKELTGKYGGLELGDRYIRKVSGARSGGKVFIHIYTFEEALKDIKNAGLSLVSSQCPYEIENRVTNIETRRRAIEVFYVAKRM